MDEGGLLSETALVFDGCKPDFVSRALRPGRTAIYLGRLLAKATARPKADATITRRDVRLAPDGTGNPFLLFCLAPQGVYHAPGIASTAGGLLPRLFTLTALRE